MPGFPLCSLPFMLLCRQLTFQLFVSQKQGRGLRVGQEKRVQHSGRSVTSMSAGMIFFFFEPYEDCALQEPQLGDNQEFVEEFF